jgi:outer membrane scaffolding protein for murein synthesis (MipA/OmpV family)
MEIVMRAKFAFFIGALLPFIAIAAPDEPSEPASDSNTPPGWSIDAGAVALAFPRFPGAREFRYLAVPDIEAHYDDLFFASVREGLGAKLLNWNGFNAGPVANFAFPRNDKNDEKALYGLANVNTTIETGGFIGWELPPYVSTKLEARKGVNGHEGLIADWSLQSGPPPFLDNKLIVSIGPHATYYDHRYAEAFYGVTLQESVASGYAAFNPNDAIKVGGSGAIVYLWSDKITSTLFTDYSRLFGGAEHSPLVLGRYGSAQQATVGLSLTYRFGL